MQELFKSKLFISLLIIIISLLVYKILCLIIDKWLLKSDLEKTREKKALSLTKLLKSIIKYLIIIIIVLCILMQFGLQVNQVIMGVGITSIIVSLAFQDILKDLIAGLFIILDNEFFVGEIIQIDNFIGEVKEIGLRNTRLKNNKGEIKIIENRNIMNVTNFSISDDVAILNLNIPKVIEEEELIRISEELLKEAKEKTNDIKKKSKLIFYGIQKLDNDTYKYQIGISCKPTKKKNVERLFLMLIKDYCILNDLEISSDILI